MTKVSFRDSAIHATRGLFSAISTERSIKIQLFIGAIIILFSVLLGISKIYLITIIVVIFLVVILEMFNRGFEKMVDLVSPEYSKEAGKIKDAMAGVVLATFTLAMIVSFLIIYDPLIGILKVLPQNPVLLILMGTIPLLICTVILIEHRKRNHQT